jgi:hypothetical protein
MEMRLNAPQNGSKKASIDVFLIKIWLLCPPWHVKCIKKCINNYSLFHIQTVLRRGFPLDDGPRSEHDMEEV